MLRYTIGLVDGAPIVILISVFVFPSNYANSSSALKSYALSVLNNKLPLLLHITTARHAREVNAELELVNIYIIWCN
ncbi:MAG: hypothetical protein WAZ77_23230 [Candidatus Nitrosopolaris sp.]